MAPGNRGSCVIPQNTVAERQAVGFAIASAASARCLGVLLNADEFYDPALGRAFEAACQLDGLEDPERRLLAVAMAVDRPLSHVEQLVADHVGDVERWAGRVRVAGLRRRLMGVAAQVHADAANGDPEHLEDLTNALAADVQALLAECPCVPAPGPTTVVQLPTIGALRRVRIGR